MSQSVPWYQDLAGEIIQGIGVRTGPDINKFVEQINGLEGPDLGFLQIAYAFAPDPVTPESYIERGPYGNPNAYKEQMDASVERGWLIFSDGGYTLSKKGKETAKEFFSHWEEWFGALPVLSDEENERIAELLAKLVQAAYQQEIPARKPTLEIGYKLAHGKDASPILRLRRHLVDMAYYRDDVHIAAWKPYGVSGKVWETLTALWRDGVSTAAEVIEQYAQYRNYSEEDYIAAFEDLVSLGWAAKENGSYVVTQEGKKIRQEAEDKTEEYFAAPFAALDEKELAELKNLLEKLADIIKPPEVEEETASG